MQNGKGTSGIKKKRKEKERKGKKGKGKERKEKERKERKRKGKERKEKERKQAVKWSGQTVSNLSVQLHTNKLSSAAPAPSSLSVKIQRPSQKLATCH